MILNNDYIALYRIDIVIEINIDIDIDIDIDILR